MAFQSSDIDELKIDRTRTPSDPPRRWWLWAIPVVVVAIVLIAVFARADKPTVKVARSEELSAGGASSVLNASGYITARRAATVSSKVTGKVVEVLVEEGMQVRQGQVLARLDPAISSQTLQLSRAQADAAASALREIQVRIDEARLDEQRAARLAGEEVGSQSDLDRARAQRRALEARLAAQRDQLEVARREVRLREQDLSDTEIRAPFAGIVVSKNAQAGEMISPMSAGGGFTRTGIATVVDMESLEIEVDVNEAYINRVQSGQRVQAILDAYPDWKIPAHVITVVPTADREKATVRVRIAIDLRDARILPDMGVKVSFIAAEGEATPQRIVVVPKAALRRDGDRDIVLVVKDDAIERRAVSVAGNDNDRARIASGLVAGEQVVIEGPAELTDGQRVKIAEETSK